MDSSSLRRTLANGRSHAWLLAAVAVAWTGCGIDAGSDLFGKGSSGDSRTGAGGAGGSGSSGEGGSSQGPGGSSSGGSGPSTSSVASSAVSVSASSAASTGAGGAEGFVSCGREECALGGQRACCWDEYQLNGRPQAECVKGAPDADDCDTDLHANNTGAEARIECQLPEHCPNGVCCGERLFGPNDFTWYSTVSCQQRCPEPHRVLCDPTAAVPCEVGLFCSPSTLLPPGYYVCSDQP